MPTAVHRTALAGHSAFVRAATSTAMTPVLLLLAAGLAGCAAAKLPAAAQQSPESLIRAAGYPAETHSVTTADGYVLSLHRIARPGATPVYLAHTLYTNAAIYLFQGKGKSIGFLLYEAGYDVWLGNYRGTFLSLNHTGSLTSSNDDYWKFGWQENGALDNPAFIDYVYAATKQQRMLYFGHSMGSTTFFSMASDRPDILDKVSAAFLCAPPVFLKNIGGFRLSFRLSNVTQTLADTLHQHRRLEDLLRQAAQKVCGRGNSLLDKLCLKAAGLNSDLAPFLSEMAAFFPGGGSVWQNLHYDQLADPKWPGFRKFNYGSAKANRAKYGSDTPPDFSLKHIKTPVYLYNGKADKSVTEADLNLLKGSLPNVKQFFFSPNAKFGHTDFVLSTAAYVDVYKQMLVDMKPYQWK